MVKARNLLRAIIFILGVFLQFTSFYVSQVEQAQWVLKIVSPKYVQGMKGVGRLIDSNSVDPYHEGFQEISEIVKTLLKVNNPNKVEIVDWIFIEKFEAEPMGESNFYGIIIKNTKVHYFLSDGQVGATTTYYLKGEFEKIRQRNIFHWALGFLIVGVIVVQIPLFFIQSGSGAKDSRDEKKPGLLSHIPPM